MHRCTWVPLNDQLYISYHDNEWGEPVRDGKQLFAKLILDSFQAGLSWRTVLHKRDNFYAAFAGLDPQAIAKFGDADIERLMQDPGIIRNKLKILATINNARVYMDMQNRGIDFADFLWGFVGHKQVRHHLNSLDEFPETIPESDAMSKALIANGFKFVGSKVCYAFMQAVGMVDDHMVGCFKYSGKKTPQV